MCMPPEGFGEVLKRSVHLFLLIRNTNTLSEPVMDRLQIGTNHRLPPRLLLSDKCLS